MSWEFIALAAIAFVFLALQHQRQRSAARAARSAIYDDCRQLLASSELVHRSGEQFPTLTGTYRGKSIRLDALVDSAAVRKLPSVWLQLNVVEALPIDCTMDLLVRPLNTEFFSPSAALPLRLPIPPQWPQHAIIKADSEPATRLLPLIDVQVRAMFDDLKCKELLVTPKGVRLTYQLAQAERSDYLVLRAMVFDGVRLSDEVFSALMEQVLATHAALSAA